MKLGSGGEDASVEGFASKDSQLGLNDNPMTLVRWKK